MDRFNFHNQRGTHKLLYNRQSICLIWEAQVFFIFPGQAINKEERRNKNVISWGREQDQPSVIWHVLESIKFTVFGDMSYYFLSLRYQVLMQHLL